MKKSILIVAILFFWGVSINAQNVSTFTGGTPDDAIAIDNAGNVYCSNYVGNAVFKFTPTGDVSSFAINLNSPNGIAFNSTGDLYVCDGQANRIYIYDQNGTPLSSHANTGHPSGIIKSHDSDAMIFTKYLGNTINTISPDGTTTVLSSDPLLVGPVGLAYDENNQLYVGNYTNRKIYKVNPDGSLIYVATVGNSSNLGFIAYANGMVWGTVLGDHKIYKINPNAIDDVEVFAGSTLGSKDGAISEATFNQPNGIIFNESADTMYISDFGSKNLRIISLKTISANSDLKINETGFIIYPNPIRDKFNLQFNDSSIDEYKIKVYNSIGQLVYTHQPTSSNHEFDSSTWESGNYFITVASNGNLETRKLNKQ